MSVAQRFKAELSQIATADPEQPDANAAVTVTVIAHAAPTIVLTRRSETLRLHAGQVSFPGGRVDDSDPSVLGAALRECHEEIGVSPKAHELLGYLPSYQTLTGFQVQPVLTWVMPPVRYTLNPEEVSAVFEVPLASFLDPLGYQRQQAIWNGKRRQYWARKHNEHVIWGATASMLVRLAKRHSERFSRVDTNA